MPGVGEGTNEKGRRARSFPLTLGGGGPNQTPAEGELSPTNFFAGQADLVWWFALRFFPLNSEGGAVVGNRLAVEGRVPLLRHQ